MSYIGVAILGYTDSTKSSFNTAVITDKYTAVIRTAVTSQQIINAISGGVKSLNFSISNNTIVEDCGAFSRLEDKNGVSPRIIIAEMVSKTGRRLGYILLDKYGRVNRVKKDDVISLSEQAKTRGVAYIQNGIYRVQDGKPMIASYPNKPFLKVVIDTSKKKVNKSEEIKSQVDKKRNEENLKHEDKYSDLQRKELDMAKANGVNPLLIANPKLSPKQMRVIWASKKNGMASEYFANPKFSLEAMRFFADRLVSRKMFNECKPIMKPDYNVYQLTELYLGIYSGIDYMSYADPSLSSEDMYFRRVELESKFYKKPELDVDEVEPDADLSKCADSFLRHKRK